MARFVARTKLSIDSIKEVEEYKALIPENNQYEELKKAIQEQGFLFPVIVNKNGELLDGYTRLRIARELGIKEIPAEIYETEGKEEELDVIASLNLKRRHLSKDELVLLIDKIHEIKKNLRKANESNFSQKNEQNLVSPHQIFKINSDKNTNSIREESKEIREELKKLVPDAEISSDTIRYYLQVKKDAPWLIQYIGDPKKGKIGIRKAYDTYQLLKNKNLLDLNQRIPKTELDQLILTNDGRKVLERDDLLDLILQHKMAVSQAINKLKTEEKLQRSKKKPRAKAEDLEEDEEEEIESIDREDSESDEYPFVEEWKKAQEEEEEKEAKQLTPQLNANENNNELEDYLKQILTEGFVELDKTKLYIVTLDGKTYLISVKAIKELKSGRGVGKYKKLEELIQSKGLGYYDPEDNAYVISQQLLA
uniref:ParB N-terminal domain-containing protein n=1 Tax=Sulfolobus sp. NOB8H2 TaxID=84600 RepID=UPI00000629E8|nr:ParB N-terminal domain-containing protein [Sulfolobus sp. NOB8H2]CAA09114.1 hypothetical protein [Sulfolobus sp. NOB8H2]